MTGQISAFERGYLDAMKGKAIKDCPYHPSTGAAIAWRNGRNEVHQADRT